MSVYSHVDGLGEVIEVCMADVVLAWRQEHRPGKKTVDTIAEHLESVECTVNLRAAGVVMITVAANGRGFLEREVHCFRAARRGNGKWKLTASSLKA